MYMHASDFTPKRKGAGASLKNNKRENYDCCDGMRRGVRVKGEAYPCPTTAYTFIRSSSPPSATHYV